MLYEHLISLFFVAMIGLGLYLISRAVKLGKKIFNLPSYLALPYLTKEATFSLPKDGNYAIWQQGKQGMKVPLDEFTVVITHLLTGEMIRLKHTFRTVKTDMSGCASMQLFSFTAKAGEYRLNLVTGNSMGTIELWLTKRLSKLFTATFDPSKYTILVKEYLSPLLIVAFVLSILLSISCIVLGGIFAANPNIILNLIITT